MRLIFVLGLLLLATSSHADNVIWMSGFDSADEDSTSYDSLEWVQVLGGSAEDADIRVQWTTIHDDDNGGSSTSHAALEVNVSAGEQAYYEPAGRTVGMCENAAEGKCTDDSECTGDCRIAENSPFPLVGEYELTVGIGFHRYSLPVTTERMVLSMVEEGDVTGCSLSWLADGTFELNYGSEATCNDCNPAFVPLQWACADPYYYLTCDDDTDCPGGAAGACTHDGSPANAEYFAPLELHERSQAPDAICDVYLAGHILASHTYTPSVTPGTIETFRLGAVDTGGATQFFVDDAVACLDDRCGFGYVGAVYPTGNNVIQWGKSTDSSSGCTATDHFECINDYGDTTEDPDYVYGDSFVQPPVPGKGKLEEYDDFGSDVGASGDLTVEAVQLVAVGAFAVAAGQRSVTARLLVNGEATQSVIEKAVAYGTTVVHQLFTITADATTSDLATLQASFTTGSTNAYRTEVGAALIYVYVTRPGEPLPETIPDGNYGDDDETTTLCAFGDSITAQTLGNVCTNNPSQGCTWDSYCSWEDELRDQPSGGCGAPPDDMNDEACRTCDGPRSRRSDVNAGAGFFCDVTDPSTSESLCQSVCDADPTIACDEDSDCNAVGGTCALNTCEAGGECGAANCCSANQQVSCDTDQDCTDLGFCDTDAECLESCPIFGGVEGTCPPGTAWITRLEGAVAYDNLIQCAQGAMTSYSMDLRFDSYVDGTYTSTVACDEDSDCIGYGANATCRDSYCAWCWIVKGTWAPPDVIMAMIGVNDSVTTMGHAPNCEGIFAGIGTSVGANYLSVPYACSPPTATACMDDSDCASVHADSVCIGTSVDSDALSTNEKLCSGTNAGYGVSANCTVYRPGCRVDADCAAFGNHGCTTDEATYYTPRGGCKCADDSDCTPFGDYQCENNICHRNCVSASDCADFSGSCKAITGTDACYGICTYPSAAEDDCVIDSDCNTVDFRNTNYLVTYHGVCESGHCTCNGPSVCPLDSTCTMQYEQD